MRYLLIFFVGSSCFAQHIGNHEIEGMSSSPNYIVQFDSLFDRAAEFGNNGRNAEALPYAEHAYQVSFLSADSFRIVRGGRVVSQLLLRLSREKEATEVALRVLPIAERNNFDHELSILYNSLGACYSTLPDYYQALMYHFKSLERRQNSGDDSQISIAYHNLGFVYYKLQDYRLALDNFSQALSLKKKSADDYDLPALLINVSLCHSIMGSYDSARNALNSSLDTCEPFCSSSIKMQQQFALGVLAYFENKIEYAESFFRNSYELAMEIGDHRFQAENLLYFARLASARLNAAESLKYLKILEEVAPMENYMLILESAYEERVSIYRSLGRHKEAWLYQDKYMAIKDKVFNERISNKILQVHSEFDEKHRRLLMNHNAEILAHQKVQNVMAGSIVLVLTFLAIALYLLMKQKQRLNVQLDQKVRERTHALELNEHQLLSELANIRGFLQKGHREFKAELASIQGISDHLTRGESSSDTKGVASLLNKSLFRLNGLLDTVFSTNQNADHRVGKSHINNL